MCAEALSQDEIDALLRGETPPEPVDITPDEEDAIKQYHQLVADAGKDVFSTLLAQDASIGGGDFTAIEGASIGEHIQGEVVASVLNHKGMLQGKSVAIMTVDNALQIVSQMMGGGADAEFGDLEESAFSEAIQSLFNGVNTQLSQSLGGEISMDPPEIAAKPEDLTALMPETSEKLILITHQLESEAVTGPIYQIIPKNMLQSLIASASAEEEEEEEVGGDFGIDFGEEEESPGVRSTPAQFASTGPAEMAPPPGVDVDISNLELILDIQLEVKVELGRTNRKIREVLELGPGSVVELNRLSGEPVDILVNDKLFAKGEVVIIDENFGVRITDILTIRERIEALK